jgi:hypothetical protein
MKILISKIKFDDKMYPRVGFDHIAAYRYSNEMKSGCVFPTIKVAKINGTYYLVDGKHRLEAHRINKEKYIEADFKTYKNKEDAYIDAIKFNNEHGKQLSVSDRIKIALRLQELKYTSKDISSLIHIPANEIKNFIGTRITNSITGKTVILKREMQSFAGEDITPAQAHINRYSVGSSLDDQLMTVIAMLETETTNRLEKSTIRLMKRLKKVINKYL